MYKLIGIDMDGTLLNSNHELSSENKLAIENARNRGISVVITTGRPLSGVEKVLKLLKMNKKDDYIILYNGALILKAEDLSVIYESTISLDEAKLLEKHSMEAGIKIHIVTADACISPTENKYGKFEADLNSMNYEIKSFDELSDDTKIYKVMLSEEPDVLREKMENIPQELYDGYETTMSAPFYIDFLSKGVNKGFGIEMLSNHIKVKQEEIICIGDAGNDISMINYASLGVAMGNASLELRKEADYITLSNDENGVAHVINRFTLMKVAV